MGICTSRRRATRPCKLWLHVHVALAIFAYGALALAAGWGVLYLIKAAVSGEQAVEAAEGEEE